MSSVLVYFKNSYSVVVLSILLSIALVWSSSFFAEEQIEKKDYIRGIVMASLITFMIIYINNLKSVNVEEVLTGVAPF
jgi:ABC-type Fe3+-siderophore transport system permease subunit